MRQLFEVKCQGMTAQHGTAYVVADDPGMVYNILRCHLDLHDLGFDYQRKLHTVTLLAQEGETSTGVPRLFIST